jgi:hypothetical protein
MFNIEKIVIDGWQTLNKMIPNLMDPVDSDNLWYLRRQASITVAAGTFRNVLVKIDLDTEYPPNAINDIMGLDRVRAPYAVTHIQWFAYGIGEALNMDVDARTGKITAVYELTSTNM